MKRQLKSLAKGLIVGVLIGLFIVHGGPAYVASLLQSKPEPIPEPAEVEILTPILAPATTTATSTDEIELETATTTATITEEVVEEENYEDIEAVLDAIEAVFTKESTPTESHLHDWFSDTKLSVLSNPYTITVSGEQFCTEHESVFENLSIRHADRISLERDQLASKIDAYSEIRNTFASKVTTNQEAESAELELLLQVLDQLATNRFGGDTYLAISSTTQAFQIAYEQTTVDSTDTYLRALRIERDRLSNTLSSSIDSFDESVTNAIAQARTDCTDASANPAEIFLTLEQALREARNEVQSSDISNIQVAVSTAYTNYEAKLQTASQIRLQNFETLR